MKKDFRIRQKQREKGFIALMSAIVISLLLITLGATLSLTGFFTRFDIADAEYKERSIGLAEACGDLAMVKLAGDINYAVVQSDHTIAVGGDSCSIVSISPTPPRSGQITIMTQGIFPALGSGPEHAYTNIKIVTNASDLSIVSWQEVP